MEKQLKKFIAKRFLEIEQKGAAAKATDNNNLLCETYGEYKENLLTAKELLGWKYQDIKNYIKEVSEREVQAREEMKRKEWEGLTVEQAMFKANRLVQERDIKRSLSASITRLCNDLEREASNHPELTAAIQRGEIEIYCPSEYYFPTYRIKEAAN